MTDRQTNRHGIETVVRIFNNIGIISLISFLIVASSHLLVLRIVLFHPLHPRVLRSGWGHGRPIAITIGGPGLTRPRPMQVEARGERWSIFQWRMCGHPVLFQPSAQMFAGLFQRVLVQDDVPHLQGALRQLLGGHQLDVHVPGLRLAARLNQALHHFGRGDL